MLMLTDTLSTPATDLAAATSALRKPGIWLLHG